MTIKDKAKAYDEALKRAKDFMNGEVHYALRKGENIMCWIFPELIESEDERVRKEIIDYLSTVDDKELIPYESWIAWLEKQKTSEEALQYLKENHSSSEVSDFQAVMNIAVAAWALGLYIYYYYFVHSYAQSCVWAVWCAFAIAVYKIKQYNL